MTDKLTAEQEGKINEYIARWEKVGLSTCGGAPGEVQSQIDWATFADAIPRLYKLSGGYAPPKYVVRVASPMGMALAAPIVAHLTAYIEEIGKDAGRVKSSGRVTVGALETLIREAISRLKNLKYVVGALHRYQPSIDDAVRASVEALGCHDEVDGAKNVEASFGALKEILKTKTGIEFQLWGYHLEGQFGAAYCSYTSFLREVLDAFKDDPKKLEHSIQYERAMGAVNFWWPGTTFCIASAKPTRLYLDERGRPHSDVGQACSWSDGFGWYAVHGVEVPDEKSHVVTNPESITAVEVKAEQNLELRRIMVQRMGYQKYFDAIGAKVLDMDSLTLAGSACRVLMRDSLGDKWLVGTDGSTSRIYTMAAPREVTTCRQAHEAISGFEESRLVAEA